MAEEKNPQQEPPQFDLNTLPIEDPEDGLYSVYSNVVNADWTLYDLRLRFAELIQVPDENNPNLKNQHAILFERVAVTIPWHQVKYLRDLLAGVVDNYEALNGELKPVKLPGVPVQKKSE